MMHHSTQSSGGEILGIADQVIAFNRESTVLSYHNVNTAGSDDCDCVHCRNYRPQRGTAFPKSFVQLLVKLGINPLKEGEVYEIGPATYDPSLTSYGKRLYGGWFFLCGRLLKAGEREEVIDGISYYVQGPGKMPSPWPRDSFGDHPLALNFTLELPWLLDEQPD